jgi:hypothetical protein
MFFRDALFRPAPIAHFQYLLSGLQRRADDLGKWLFAGEVSTRGRGLRVFRLKLQLKRLFDRLARYVRVNPDQSLKLRQDAEGLLLGALALHPCWVTLWHRAIVHRLLYWGSDPRSSSKFAFDVLVESQQDLRTEVSPFSGYLAFALQDVMDLVKRVEKGKPHRLVHVLRHRAAPDFLSLAERRVLADAGSAGVFQWHRVAVSDFWVAAICHEEAEILRRRLERRLMIWRKRRWWEWLFPDGWRLRVRLASRIASWFDSAIIGRLARLNVVKPLLCPELPWDEERLTPVLSLLGEHSSRGWRHWLEWCICRRLQKTGGEETGLIYSLSRVLWGNSRPCQELVLRVASRGLGDLIIARSRLGFTTWGNIKSFLGLCSELVLWVVGQKKGTARQGTGIDLESEASLFLKALERALVTLLQSGPEGLLRVGEFLQKLLEGAIQSGLDFLSLESALTTFRLRHYLERWTFGAVCYDLPKIQGRVGVFGDVEPDSDGQLRRAVQRCIERWLEDYCHVDSSAASMLSQEDAISEQLREIGNKLARLDSEVATLMRLVIVRALCRAKHTLLKGGVG